LRSFGYRSVHLIARAKPGGFSTSSDFLGSRWFEIQVRSILEHAWAEIEHEVVYKSGIVQPGDVLRRFASMAGNLEILDNEFETLRQWRNKLIDSYREKYERRVEFKRPFDVARLLAFLETTRAGRSWRQAEADGRPFASGLDVVSVEAVKAVGLGTPWSLLRLFRSPRFRYAARTFAAGNGIDVESISHLAAVVNALAVKNPRFVRLHFPEMLFDPALNTLIERRARS
jgi:hypothetical protein